MGMDLKTWLFRNQISQDEFCEKIDMSRGYMSLVINYKTIPSKKLVRLIEKATKGEVRGEYIINEAYRIRAYRNKVEKSLRKTAGSHSKKDQKLSKER
jgi:transcriptional regulator with XRE-family HTH domain